MGPHMQRLMRFAIDYPGWHTMSNSNPSARRAMYSLAAKGLLEISGGPRSVQFRLVPPKSECDV